MIIMLCIVRAERLGAPPGLGDFKHSRFEMRRDQEGPHSNVKVCNSERVLIELCMSEELGTNNLSTFFFIP